MLRTSYTNGLSGIIAIDGTDGVGKTTLAVALQETFGGTLVSLDNFVLENQGGYVPYLKTAELKNVLGATNRPIIVEGVCVLSALERIYHERNVLIYVKRLVGYGYWHDEDVCDPTEPIEELIARRAEEVGSFARLDAQLSGESLSEDEKPRLTPLREENIRYHERYRPSRHADIIFLKRG